VKADTAPLYDGLDQVMILISDPLSIGKDYWVVPYFSSLRTSALSAFICFTYEFNAEFAEVRRERREQFQIRDH